MHKFKENYKPAYGVFSSALGGETNDKVETATYVDMKYYDAVVVYVIATNVVNGQKITLQLLEATDSSGTNATAISGKTDTFTSTGTSAKDVLQAEVRAEELSSGYRYVGFRVSTDDADGQEYIAGILLQGRARYGSSSLP